MNFWDTRYSESGFSYGSSPNDFLVEAVKYIPRGRVLCIAEGEGRNAVYLASLGYDVTAVDSSAVGMEKASGYAAGRGLHIETVVSDLADYVIEPAAWDGIVAVFAHLPPPLREKVHRACVAGLRPEGVFILEAYTPRQLEYKTGGPPVAEMLYTPEMLRSDLDGLEFAIFEETVREIHEGKYHNGPGAVIRVAGIKPAY